MKLFHKPPRGAKKRTSVPSDPAPSEPPPVPQEPFDLRNPDHARWWGYAMREAVLDLSALVREATRRVRHRVLSRAEILRQAREAEAKLNGLVDRAISP